MISLFLSPFNKITEASSLLIKEDEKMVNANKHDEKILDELLGPDVNFPFRPESHYDNSGPVKRIGAVLDD